jgi:uncharacterized membrane protein
MMNIIEKQKRWMRLHLSLVVIASCLFSIALCFFRFYYTHTIMMGFLLWNLFLAGIPLAISTMLYIGSTRKISGFVFSGCVMAWLLFFPNSPYILTDMLHLSERPPVPIWYDVLLMISFAWNGFIMGLLSLMDVHTLIAERFGVKSGWLFAAFSICLGSFGIYLGRFDRWNSWDILTNPFSLMADIFNHIVHPFAHPRTVVVTFLFSVFIGIAYYMMRLLTRAVHRQ